MKTKLLLLVVLTFMLAGCGGGGGGSSSTPPSAATEDISVSAGVNQSQVTPASLTLTGTGSSSLGNAVTFQWAVTSANASSATLATPTAASTNFSATVTGDYTVQLTVTSSTSKAATDTVIISVTTAAANGTLGSSGSYFPLTQLTASGVQRVWHYTSKTAGGASVDVDATVDHKLHSIINSAAPTEITNSYSFPTTGALFAGGMIWTSQVALTDTSTFNPGVPIFPSDLTPGGAATLAYVTTLASGGTFNHTTTLTVANDVTAPRTIDGVVIPASSIIHIHSVTTGTASSPPDSWYALGIGLIEDSNLTLATFSK